MLPNLAACYFFQNFSNSESFILRKAKPQQANALSFIVYKYCSLYFKNQNLPFMSFHKKGKTSTNASLQWGSLEILRSDYSKMHKNIIPSQTL